MNTTNSSPSVAQKSPTGKPHCDSGSIILFRLFTGIAAVYHLILAAAALLLPNEVLASALQVILGVTPTLEGDLLLAVPFAGAYVLAFGIGLALLSWKPLQNRALLPGVLALFGVRLLNRVLLFSTLAEQYELSTVRNLFGVASLLVLFIGILLTAPRKARA